MRARLPASSIPAWPSLRHLPWLPGRSPQGAVAPLQQRYDLLFLHHGLRWPTEASRGLRPVGLPAPLLVITGHVSPYHEMVVTDSNAVDPCEVKCRCELGERLHGRHLTERLVANGTLSGPHVQPDPAGTPLTHPSEMHSTDLRWSAVGASAQCLPFGA